MILDIYSMMFLRTLSLISGSIYLFSRRYIREEPIYWRFHALVILFVISIALLIISPNLLRILLGWDGLGVTSYLLVIFFQRTKAYNAGMLTALRNRVGDILILASIARVGWRFSWNFYLLSIGRDVLGGYLPALIAVAACTKRAQIPFSAWLPAAIAAPTPVSSLVHSSTLVTAGIYLLFRFEPWISSKKVIIVICLLGSLTILIAGLAALREIDIKKVVALSTLSQLGVMATTLGIGLHTLAFFHLLSHAFFKALLFIRVGSIIHISSDYQDLRKSGTAISICPFTLTIRIRANLRLCGIPFTRGFFSKDNCIEYFITNGVFLDLSLIFYVATGLTVAYSVRFVYLRFNWSQKIRGPTWVNEKDPFLIWSMSILLPVAVCGGCLFSWSIFYSPLFSCLSVIEKNLTLVFIVRGVIIGILACTPRQLNKRSKFSFTFLMWALPSISSRIFVSKSLIVGRISRSIGDQYWRSLFSHPPSFSLKTGNSLLIKTSRVVQSIWLIPIFALLLWNVLYLCVKDFSNYYSFKNRLYTYK